MSGFLELSLEIGFMCVVASVVLAFVRMIKGPSLQDRVVALDFMTVAIVAFCVYRLFTMDSRDDR